MNAKISVFTICVKAIAPLEQQLKKIIQTTFAYPSKNCAMKRKKEWLSQSFLRYTQTH